MMGAAVHSNHHSLSDPECCLGNFVDSFLGSTSYFFNACDSWQSYKEYYSFSYWHLIHVLTVV